MTKSMKITMVVEKTNTGYSAYAKDAAVFTVASDLNELVCEYRGSIVISV